MFLQQVTHHVRGRHGRRDGIYHRAMAVALIRAIRVFSPK
jgi:hypothetical protein